MAVWSGEWRTERAHPNRQSRLGTLMDIWGPQSTSSIGAA